MTRSNRGITLERVQPTTQMSPPVEPAAWENGAYVGRYILLSPIAQGGMAEIWLARQSGMQGFEKVVVVKRMINALEADPEHVEMFLSEARLAAQLNHPNIVQIYELGEFHGSYYIAMEYLDGENLATVRRAGRDLQRPLPDALAARLIAWAAEGLHAAHTKVGLDGRPLHIVHRDVSPQNLIVTYDGGLKVVDFGIAKVATHNTMSGKLKGKLAYMSPEQARAESADARSDVFALGIVLFELLTRTRLLQRMTDLEILQFMGGDAPIPRATSRRPDIPGALDAIVARAMARDPAERFQSAREMQSALEEWLRTGSVPASSSAVAEYMQTLFADRIRERRKLIEAAMSAELTPATARTLGLLAQQVGPGSASAASRNSGSQSQSMTMSRPPPPSRRWLGLAAAGVLLVGGGGAWLGTRARGADPVAVEPVRLPTPNPVLVVTSDPSPISLTIDGEPRGVTPASLEGLAPGEHVLEGGSPGYQPLKRTITLARDGRTQVVLSLVAVPGQPPPPEVPLKPAEPARPVVKAAPALPVAQASGKLTLKTEPWTTVFLGKQKLGDTPLLNVPLPAGHHVLTLTNAESNISTSIEVEINANETTMRKLRL